MEFLFKLSPIIVTYSIIFGLIWVSWCHYCNTITCTERTDLIKWLMETIKDPNVNVKDLELANKEFNYKTYKKHYNARRFFYNNVERLYPKTNFILRNTKM